MLSTLAILIGIITIKNEHVSLGLSVVCGIVLSLCIITKLTTAITVMTIATLFLADAIFRRRWRFFLQCGLYITIPLILIGGGYLLSNLLMYDDLSPEKALLLLTPGTKRPETAHAFDLLKSIFP